MTILRPIFGRGVAQRRLGTEVPEFRQKFPVLLGAPVVPKAQIWNSKKMCLGPPPPLSLWSFSAYLYVLGNVFYYSCFKGTILATKRRFIAVCPHVDSKVSFTSCFTSINSYSYSDRVHFVETKYTSCK